MQAKMCDDIKDEEKGAVQNATKAYAVSVSVCEGVLEWNGAGVGW